MAGVLHPAASTSTLTFRSALTSSVVASSRAQLCPRPLSRGETCLRAIRIDRINKRKDEDAIQSEEDLEVSAGESSPYPWSSGICSAAGVEQVASLALAAVVSYRHTAHTSLT